MADETKCSRCGRDSKPEEMTATRAGMRFCPECWSQVNPKNEVLRKCPADGANMRKRLVGDVVVIDVCIQCGGLWFDKGELEIIERKSREMGWNQGFFTSIMLL